MKMSAALLSVFLFLSAQVCLAAPAETEDAASKLDSITVEAVSAKSLPVTAVLSQIQSKIKDSGVVISSRIPAKYVKKITLELQKKTLRECLTAVAKSGYQWTASGKVISVIPNDFDYKMDNIWISNFVLDSCPVRTALTELQKRTGKPGMPIRILIAPNMERSVSITIKKRKTLRACLAEFGRYGYVWSKSGQGISVSPVAKVNEWKTGFGTLKIDIADARWANTQRVAGAKFANAPFAEVEKFLRTKKINVGSVGRTPVRVTMAAGNVTLKQFLTAVCFASGFDCEVKGKRVTFRKGPAIGFYLADNQFKQQLVSRKFPVIRKEITLTEFIQKADPRTAWVIFHAPRINMKNLKYVVTPEISGNTMPDALQKLQKDLHLRVLYASGVVAIFPNHNRARYAFYGRMRSPIAEVKFDNATYLQVLNKIQKDALAADETRQGTPMVPYVKLTPKKVSIDLKNTSSDELLKRLNLALGYYGYISLCGTHYVVVKSGLFNFKGITISPLEPLVLNEIISGADSLDVPLDFKQIKFTNVSVENILKFAKLLNEVRFTRGRAIRWSISNPDLLKRSMSFTVESPSLRSLLDALALRTGLSLEIESKGVYIK